ncbi:hypothetical protein BN1097_190039 [Clostridioides difficile]|uniref:Uncharacterized protein n=1 Tax=Clostridioides difficile TaxID=1496 RepID=A0A069A5V5_CLODI|nr:hypothetical protein BN1097_190039 [Clostridioides difficile]
MLSNLDFFKILYLFLSLIKCYSNEKPTFYLKSHLLFKMLLLT